MRYRLKRISMVVWNQFLHDARVMKEAETLQSAGYKVTVHALHEPGLTSQRETLPTGIDIRRVSASPYAALYAARRSKKKIKNQSEQGTSSSIFSVLLIILSRLWAHLGLMVQIGKAKPDIIHAHDVNTLPTAWLAAKITRSSIVYDAHEISTGREGYANYRSLVWCIEKHLMPRAAGTITTTKTRAKYFSRAYRVPRPLVLQNRPRYCRYSRSNRIREELSLDQSWPIVLYQGGLQKGRGLELLVNAAALVKNAYFVFIGGGRLETILKDRVHSLKLDDRVYFIPTVALNELLYYTASADIGIQPIENTCLNHYSTDSNKLFEYVQAGLPVIATGMPEIRRIVKEYNLGLLVPEGDSSALAHAINELVQDPVKRKSFSNNCQQTAAFLNWEAQEHALIDLYRCILPEQEAMLCK